MCCPGRPPPWWQALIPQPCATSTTKVRRFPYLLLLLLPFFRLPSPLLIRLPPLFLLLHLPRLLSPGACDSQSPSSAWNSGSRILEQPLACAEGGEQCSPPRVCAGRVSRKYCFRVRNGAGRVPYPCPNVSEFPGALSPWLELYLPFKARIAVVALLLSRRCLF